MLKPLFLCAVLLIVAVSGLASAPPHAANAAEQQTIYGPDAGAVSPALLTDIVAWVSQNFDLPVAERLPQVVFLPPSAITALRYRGFVAANSGAASTDASDIVAVYEPTSETIYLPEGWRGTKPTDMSVLVHEVTHHLQHQAQLKYACPAEREQLAYAAQQRWLQQSGRSLASEFGADEFTLLVLTNCGF